MKNIKHFLIIVSIILPGVVIAAGSGTVTPLPVKVFTGLSDTPHSYSGQANKIVIVNGSSTGLTFISTSSLGISGGGGTPGGSSTQIQYNNAGVFGGDLGFTWNEDSKMLTISTTSTNAPNLLTFHNNLNPGAGSGIAFSYNFMGIDLLLNQIKSIVNPHGLADLVFYGPQIGGEHEYMRLAGSGDLLIGTSTDDFSSKLRVVGTTTSDCFSNDGITCLTGLTLYNPQSTASENKLAYQAVLTGDQQFGVAFYVSTTTVLDHTSFWINRNGETADIYSKIYSMTGTYGVDALPDTELAVSDVVSLATAPWSTPATQTTDFNFSGSNKITLTPGYYVATIESTSANYMADMSDGSTVGVISYADGSNWSNWTGLLKYGIYGKQEVNSINGLVKSGNALSIDIASASKTGALSSTDFTTFNNKVSNVYASSTFPSFTYASSTFLTKASGTALYVPYTGATKNVEIGAHDFLSGSTASSTYFPYSQAIFSHGGPTQGVDGNFYGAVGQTIAGYGLGGFSQSTGATLGAGIIGKGLVASTTGDTGNAFGVMGYSTTNRTNASGGMNIGGYFISSGSTYENYGSQSITTAKDGQSFISIGAFGQGTTGGSGSVAAGYFTALAGATGDTGVAYGLKVLSTATHAGANNYGIYSSASGGADNFAYYSDIGKFYNAGVGQFAGLLTTAGINNTSGTIVSSNNIQSSTGVVVTNGSNASVTVGTSGITNGYSGQNMVYAGANTLGLQTYAGAWTTRAMILNDGSFGIGTSTPTTRLQIVNPTAAATTTVAIGSVYNTKPGKMCYWNTTNYTIEYFAPNSITPIYSTSTTCQ